MTVETSASVYDFPRAFSWKSALFVLLGTSISLVHASGSFQNGRIDGALYAGGIDYTEHNILVTGITYGTNGGPASEEAKCFVSSFRPLMLGSHEDTFSRTIGNGKKMQSCHAISALHDTVQTSGISGQLVVAGTKDPGKVYGASPDQPSGFLVSLAQGDNDRFPIVDAISTNDDMNKVSYPVSVIYVHGHDSDGNGDKFNNKKDGVVYVASLYSKDLTENPGNSQLAQGSNDQPNWMKYYKYGSSFQLELQKFTMKHGSTDTTIEESWHRFHHVQHDDGTPKPDVFVGGMILKRTAHKDHLIVAGSTSGHGEAFGESAPGSLDEDGFIAVFDGHTGDLRSVESSAEIKSHTRLGTAETDLILGICHDPSDKGHFYIVGSTGDPSGMGTPTTKHKAVLHARDGSLHGFVQKIHLKTLERVWGTTWSAKYDVSRSELKSITAGIGCRVNEDGTLYVAGIVEDGAWVIHDRETVHAHNDIVALKLNSGTGDVEWLTQFGSEDGDENLARSGAIATDPNGNLVLLGDTTGSLFRKRDDETDSSSDIFLATLSKADGSHDSTVPANHKGDWHFGKGKGPAIGMLSGGKWKDDEVYGLSKWSDTNALGIQSGPTSGSVFAGGMVYDASEDAVYLTGIAYEGGESLLSSCMVTKLPLEKKGFNGWASANGKLIGQKNVLEVCNSIALHGSAEVVAIGSADKGSTLQHTDYPMAGFAVALDRFDLEQVDTTTLVSEIPNKKIQYPIDIVTDGDDMYVVSLTSIDHQKTKEFNKLMQDGSSKFSPNWINLKKYGSSFDMTVTKLSLKEEMVDGVPLGNIEFTTQWSKEFPVDPDGDNTGTIPRVFLGGATLMKNQGYLAVSGSTRGMGEGYGAAKGNDEDGFVALLDLATGELSGTVQRNSLREGTAQDDAVHGMCGDPSNDEVFYIVGETKGTMPKVSVDEVTETPPGSTQAFMLKINAKTLQTVWAVQLGALNKEKAATSTTATTAKAYDCAVSGDAVYVGGVVDGGAGIVANGIPRNSRGGIDTWLGSYDTDGNLNWLRQMGSEGDDEIAPRGGLTINKNGNVLMFGHTNGEFFREHVSTDRTVYELFLMEVSAEGNYKPHMSHTKHKATPTPVPVSGGSVPSPAPVPSAPGPSAPEPSISVPGSIPDSTAPPFLVNSDEARKEYLSSALFISLVVVGSFVVIFAAIIFTFVFRTRICPRRETDSGFNVKDGLVADRNVAKAPPSSSFRNGSGIFNGSGEIFNGSEEYSENLKATEEDRDII